MNLSHVFTLVDVKLYLVIRKKNIFMHGRPFFSLMLRSLKPFPLDSKVF